jgi:hypothetical protein
MGEGGDLQNTFLLAIGAHWQWKPQFLTKQKQGEFQKNISVGHCSTLAVQITIHIGIVKEKI